MRPYAVFRNLKQALDWAEIEGPKRGLRLEVRVPRSWENTTVVVDADEEDAARMKHEQSLQALTAQCSALDIRPKQDANSIDRVSSPQNAPVAIRAVVETIMAIQSGKPIVSFEPGLPGGARRGSDFAENDNWEEEA